MWIRLGNKAPVQTIKHEEIDASQHSVEELRKMADEINEAHKEDDAGRRIFTTVKLDDKPDKDLLAARISNSVDLVPLEEQEAETFVEFGEVTDSETGKKRYDTAFQDLTLPGGVLSRHFASGATAAWVEGDDEFFTRFVAEFLGCPVGRPKGWKGFTSSETPSKAEASAATKSVRAINNQPAKQAREETK